MNDALIKQQLDRIERKLSQILGNKREVWVGAADVMKATGLNKTDLYRMRKSGAILFKKVGKSIVYNPDSIPSIFIRHENIPFNPTRV
jgi:hypothetical protein